MKDTSKDMATITDLAALIARWREAADRYEAEGNTAHANKDLMLASVQWGKSSVLTNCAEQLDKIIS